METMGFFAHLRLRTIQATLLRRGQGDPSSIHGVTESQNCSGMTFSQNYHMHVPLA